MKQTFTLRNTIIAIFTLFSIQAFAQTPGTLTFSVTTGASDCVPCSDNSESPQGHVLAIWIENSSNAFVKTKLLYAAERDYDLATWNIASNGNIVDATTGATKFVHESETITWNGTDVSGNIVADGSYTIFVEMSWDSEGGVIVSSFPFTKGTNADNQTPTATTYFSNMTLAWTPQSGVGLAKQENSEISIFPNPASNNVSINLGNQNITSNVKIFNAIGVEVYSKTIESTTESLQINLGNYTEGVYFVKVQNKNIDSNYKLVVRK